MSVRHHKAVEFEDRLKTMFDRINNFLEQKYAGRFPLHPARPEHGTTGNREHDGLFNVGASFALGAGSKYGPGYIVEIRIVTLEKIAASFRQEIDKDVLALLERELKREFKDKSLTVAKEGDHLKIYGDLSLGVV